MALFSNGRWTWPWIAATVLAELDHRDRMDRLAAVHREQDEREREMALEQAHHRPPHPQRDRRPSGLTDSRVVALVKAEADRARADRRTDAVLARQRARLYG